MDSVYTELTRAFNQGRTRAILSSGQAVVYHRLAIMSKDGDWIVREDTEVLRHVLRVLEQRGARYRYGAPLDERWLAGGWSSHLEFMSGPVRVRTDFVSRPPRLSDAQTRQLWSEQDGNALAVIDKPRLALLKMTNREKDYAVIGELSRSMDSVSLQARFSRSARDLIALQQKFPDIIAQTRAERPLLSVIGAGEAALETALDAERRELMHANERRLTGYLRAASAWAGLWPSVEREIASLPLVQAHVVITQRAQGVLPYEPAP